MIAATTLAAAVPFAGAQNADYEGCTPVRDLGALPLAGTYFKVYQDGMNRYEEMWYEVNGIDGLQTSSAAACGGPADELAFRHCVGRWCPQ